ncbi:MAG: hypothetical protein MJ245_07515 [Clostridia bacterium]|nr:hypothetical protein [Clostridia bacterium]
MEKIINISGKEVKLASTAGTLHRYRMQFKRDLTKDIILLENTFKDIKTNNADFTAIDLELFENIAWSLAKTADSSIKPIDEWLDQFETFDIYRVLPVIMEMLQANFQSLNNDEKKAVAPEVQQEN